MPKSILTILGTFFAGCLLAYGDALDNWTNVSVSPLTNYNEIIFANGTFVATANPNTVYNPNGINYNNGYSVSSDGTHWDHYSTGDVSSGLAYGNGMFARSGWWAEEDGDGGGAIVTTNAAGLDVFGPYPHFNSNGQYGIAYGKGVFVAVGYYYEQAMGTIYNSTDGVNWNACTASTSDLFMQGVAYGNGSFVAIGPYPYLLPPWTNSHVLRSSDGTNWSLVPNTFTASLPALNGISFVNGTFYATPMYGHTNAYSSSSGIIWTNITPPYPSLYVTGTYSNGLYISVHPGYPLATSPDGKNWTVRNTGITNVLTGIAYGNNCFVLCTADGSFFRSGNTTPSLHQVKSGPQGFQLSITDGIGPKYQIQASTNLVDWTNLATLTNIQGSNTYLDANASNFTRRYYRTVAQ